MSPLNLQLDQLRRKTIGREDPSSRLQGTDESFKFGNHITAPRTRSPGACQKYVTAHSALRAARECACFPNSKPPDQGRLPEILLNVPDSFVPMFLTPLMMTIEISAAINPYSIAVAPDSFSKKALRDCATITLLFEETFWFEQPAEQRPDEKGVSQKHQRHANKNEALKEIA